MKKPCLADFQVGQEVWIERRGAFAHRKDRSFSSLFFPGTVEKVGNKYVVVSGRRYCESGRPLFGLVEFSNSGVESVLYPSYEWAKGVYAAGKALEELQEKVRDMSLADVEFGNLTDACNALSIPIPPHKLSGYEDLKSCIDSFSMGKVFQGLPQTFDSYAYESIKIRKTEEQIMGMDEKDVLHACRELAQEFQKGEPEEAEEERERD